MKQPRTRRDGFSPLRIFWLGGIFFVLGAGILWRFTTLAVIDHDYYRKEADGQRTVTRELQSERGEIFFQDRFGERRPAAVNKETALLYAVPRDIEKPAETAARLAPLLGIAETTLKERLERPGDPYEVIAPHAEENTRHAVEALGLPGVHFSPATLRFYPGAAAAAVITGFRGFREGIATGQYGLEEFYEEELRGREGSLNGERDTLGRLILTALSNFAPAEHGRDLVLGIDPTLQTELVRVLKATLDLWQAPAGSALVMEPNTGKILAMAAFPSYDPNAYTSAKDISLFVNPLVQQRFEPGSVFKPFTMAAGLTAGVVKPETTYEDPGEMRFGGYTIANFDNRSHGLQTMTQVLEKSLNTGAIFVQQRVGKERFLQMLYDFGFNELTGVDLPGELSSNIVPLEAFRDLEFATASFGQGVAVTPVALARAMAAIANGGKLVTPFLVEKRVTGDEEIVTQPRVVREVLSPSVARTLREMLTSVVDNGPGYRRAKIKGYALAGKTGTAQIPSPAGGYSADVIHSFVGFGPASNPKFLVLLKMDRPTGDRFAANTLTSAFREIAKFLIEYYEIPPDRPEEVAK